MPPSVAPRNALPPASHNTGSPTPPPHPPITSSQVKKVARTRVIVSVTRKSVELRGSAYDYRDSTFQLTFSALNLRVFPVSSTTRVIAVSVNEKCNLFL